MREQPPEDFNQQSSFVTEELRMLLEHAGITWAHKSGTPQRLRRVWAELRQHRSEFNFTVFDNTEEKYDQIIAQTGIRFTSWCAHHVLPFLGTAAVGYIPKSKYCGLSKLARTVEYFAGTLQTQERLTKQIGQFLLEKLEDPLGVAVVIKATHTCMTSRGVRQPDSVTVTSFMQGVFLEKPEARAEFLALLRHAGTPEGM